MKRLLQYLYANLIYTHRQHPPEWIVRRWPALERLHDNPIVNLDAARAGRRLLDIDPVRFFLPPLFVIVFLALLFFLNIFGVILFAILLKVVMMRLPRRHLHRRLFGIESDQLLRDLVQTPLPAEDILWGALTPRISVQRIKRLCVYSVLALAAAATLLITAGAPPIILFMLGAMGLEALALYLLRLDSIEIHLLRQVTIALWTRRAGRKRDVASLFGKSIMAYVLIIVAWLVLTVPAILVVELLTVQHVGRVAVYWEALAGLSLSLLALFNVFVYIAYQNENYNVREMTLLYDDVLRAGAGVELNKNLDWIPVPVEEQTSEIDMLDLKY